MRWRRELLCCVGTIFLLFNTGQAHAQEDRLDLNWLGHSAAEVRAMTPGISWIDAPTGYESFQEMVAPEFATIGGVQMGARLHITSGRVVLLELERDLPVENAATCEAAGIALISGLERTYGPFSWRHYAEGRGHLVRIGQASTIMVAGWQEPFSGLAPRRRFSDPAITGFAIRANGQAMAGDAAIPVFLQADLWDGICEIRVTLPYEV